MINPPSCRDFPQAGRDFYKTLGVPRSSLAWKNRLDLRIDVVIFKHRISPEENVVRLLTFADVFLESFRM